MHGQRRIIFITGHKWKLLKCPTKEQQGRKLGPNSQQNRNIKSNIKKVTTKAAEQPGIVIL